MMIYVICVTLFIVPAVFSSFPAATHGTSSYDEVCAKDSGVSDQSIVTARQVRQLIQTPEMNAFAKCMLLQHNVMSFDGTINTDVRTYSTSDVSDDLRRVSQICNSQRGNDAGDTARRILNCYWENNQLKIVSWSLA